jgi:hypothetical protein
MMVIINRPKTPGSIIQKEDLIEISLSKTSSVEMNLYHAP